MHLSQAAVIPLAGTFILASCATPSSDQSNSISTAVAGTVQALATIPPVTATQMPSQTPSPSSNSHSYRNTNSYTATAGGQRIIRDQLSDRSGNSLQVGHVNIARAGC